MAAEITRPVSWIASARRDFDNFPADARDTIVDALTMAAAGGMAGIAKPLKGLGSGIFEIALRNRGNAFRTVHAVQIHDDLWVIHVFRKKSTKGIKTPKHEIELIMARLKRLQETLR